MDVEKDPDALVLRSRVPPSATGLALLDYLCARFPYHDRERWRALLAVGRVRWNGRRARPDQAVRLGDEIAYERRHPEPPVDKRVRVLHEDPHLVVAFKPAHLPSHADGPFVRHTFAYLLAELLARGGPRPRLRLAHRLDRETSGVLAVARSAEAGRALELQLREGRVEKEYLAVVDGRVATDRLDIDRPIARATGGEVSLRRTVVEPDAPGARAARTECVVVERLRDCTLLAVRPRTGRTHQIRVHLHAAGHPVIGDKLYGRTDAQYLDFVRRVKRGEDPRRAVPDLPADRQLLHAGVLGLRHPATGERLRFQVPPPRDIQDFLEARRRRLDAEGGEAAAGELS